LFLAHTAEGQQVAYAIAYLSKEGAELPEGFDHAIILSEIGTLPGHGEAIPHLLCEVANSMPHERVLVTSFLPTYSHTDEALRLLIKPPAEELDDLYMMARPLAEGMSQEEIDAIMAAPKATFWHLDLF
ncbi:MAG: hypothetical protein M3328_16660, partial [Chloroflexota bacterium]|nr:hypothetical protein [Chloroflexota bacterium]